MMERSRPNESPTLFDYWSVVWRFRMMIAGLVVCSVLVTGIVCKLSVKQYEANAIIIPAQESASGGGFSFGGGGKGEKGGGGGPSMVMDVLGGKSGGPSLMDTLNTLLASRKIGEIVAEQLNLMAYYDTDSITTAARAVQGEVRVKMTMFKALEISVLTKDPEMAAAIVNAYCSALDRLNREFTVTASKRTRQFLEERLVEKRKKLEVAESALKDFQTEHKVLGSDEKSEGPMGAAEELNSQIMEYEIELAALREYAMPNHPMLNQLQAKIEASRRQLDQLDRDQMQKGLLKERKRSPLSQRVFPAVIDMPLLFLEMHRLNREVKVEEAVYGMLLGMLESAKMTEVRDLPTIQVIDPALPPTFPSSPKTVQNIKIAAIVSLVFGVLLAFFIGYLEQLRAEVALRASLDKEAGDLVGDDSNGNGNKSEEHSVPLRTPEHLHG